MSLTKRNYDKLLKFVILGDSGVGKSCILTRFSDDTYTESFISTIGVDFRFKNISLDHPSTKNHINIKLQIWDTAGQERFRNLASAYYRSSDGLIVVYDITHKKSFDNIMYWIEDAQKYVDEYIPIIVIGNKSDRIDREVTFEELKIFAEKRNVLYLETSAKDNINIDDVFVELTERCLIENSTSNEIKENTLNINNQTKPSRYNNCC